MVIYLVDSATQLLNNCSQAPVVQKVDSAIHWISYYLLFSAIGYHNTYPLDSDLYGGAFEKLRPSDLYCLKLLLVT